MLLAEGLDGFHWKMRRASRQPPAAMTLLKVTPSHLKLLNHRIPLYGYRSPMRALMIGGEPLEVADVRFWQERFPDVRLINHFGATGIWYWTRS